MQNTPRDERLAGDSRGRRPGPPRMTSPGTRSQRARILLVTEIFPPQIGGPATFIDRLGGALAARGHRVSVVCSSDTPVHASDRDRPFRVVRICGRTRIARELRTRLVLARELFLHRLVLVNGLESQAAAAARRLRRRYTLKIVGDIVWEAARNEGLTDLDIDAFQSSPSADASLERVRARRARYLEGASRIIIPSEYLRAMVTGWGVAPEKTAVVFNGVEERAFAEPPAGRRPGELLDAVFVGRLTNWKGVDAILLAVRNLAGVRATIIGDGPELPAMKDLCRRLKLSEKIVFTGRMDAAGVEERLSRAHVLILPSLYEGLSHALLEAGAKAVPCIASDRGGNPEVLADGVDGFLIDPWDTGALEDRLSLLRDREELRRGMGLAFRKKVGERFAFATTVERTIELLLSP